MRLIPLSFVLAAALASVGCKASVKLGATADTEPTPDKKEVKPAAEKFEWKEIGKQTVEVKGDRDVFEVPDPQSKWWKAVKFKVENADIKVTKIIITLGNGDKYEPETQVTFESGDDSKQIDLPGEKRHIRNIEFWYSKAGSASDKKFGPGGGGGDKATVVVMGLLES